MNFMKATPKQYALSLYELVENKSAAQVKPVIKKFVELLAAKNQLDKAEKIIREFLKIWNEKKGIVEAGVASAKKLDKEAIKQVKNHIAKLAGAKEVIIQEKIDGSLLGGVVIKYGDKVLDGSLKMQLEELKNKLVK